MTTRISVLVTCLLAMLCVFIGDMFSVRGLAIGVCYVVPVMIAMWSPKSIDMFLIAAVSVVLVIVGIFVSPELPYAEGRFLSDLISHSLSNRFLAVMAIGVATVLGRRRRSVEQALTDLNETLETRVDERTADLKQRTLELESANRSIVEEANQRQQVTEALKQYESRYLALVESLPLNVFQKDVKGRIIFCNKRYCESLNHSFEFLQGKTDFDLFPEPLASKYVTDDEYVMQSGVPLEDIEEHRADGASSTYVQVLKAPICDADGNTIGIQGMFWDVTRRIEAEEKQRRSDARFRRLVESNIIGVFTATTDGDILEANDKFLSMVGYSREEFERGDIRWDDLTPVEYKALDENAIRQLGESGIAQPWEKQYFTRYGERVSCLLGVSMLDEGNQCICFALDISDRIEAEKQLELAKQSADAASLAKSQFLANMSHEVRTPMNAIIGMTELVLDSDLGSQQREYLDMVLEAGESLLSIINHVLDLTRVEAGRMELVEAPFDLRESLGDMLKTLAVRAHAKGLELTSCFEAEVPETLVGDEGRLRQIVTNLVGNAIKFTESGEINFRVSLRSRTLIESEGSNGESVQLYFSVRDTGPGIPENMTAAIFFPFEQIDNGPTRAHGGTGLGLAIAASFVELMGGTIGVESRDGEPGSKFHFSANFTLADEAPAGPLDQDLVSGHRVLVVDDNESNREILAAMLTNWRMNQVTVASAAEAEQAIENETERPFDLLLLDERMPAENGIDLALRLKDDARWQGRIVMMLTASEESTNIDQCQAAGVSAYLMKPVKQSELFDAIVLALGLGESSGKTERALPKLAAVKPLEILLAEDSLVNQKLATALLRRCGHTVHIANNGKEAVSAVKKNHYDIVLMDVQMPEMDGLTATRRIRELEQREGRHTPIMAMTAHAMQGDRDRCLEAGMDEYVSKPIRAALLFEKIAELVPDEIATPMINESSESLPDDAGAPAAENTQANSSAESPINWASALEATAGSEEILLDVADGFLEECPRQLANLKSALKDSDFALIRRSAHTLKGSLRLFGCDDAQSHAFAIEEMGKNEQLEGVESELHQLSAKLAEVEIHIRRYVKEGVRS